MIWQAVQDSSTSEVNNQCHLITVIFVFLCGGRLFSFLKSGILPWMTPTCFLCCSLVDSCVFVQVVQSKQITKSAQIPSALFKAACVYWPLIISQWIWSKCSRGWWEITVTFRSICAALSTGQTKKHSLFKYILKRNPRWYFFLPLLFNEHCICIK